MRILLVTLACLALLVACSAEPAPSPSTRPTATEVWQTDTELVTAIGGDPDTIDPQKASFAHEMAIDGMLYESLLTWDPATLALVPAAARALPAVSPNGLRYTYTLRDGLVYSDGTPLTARRFVDAFLRLCDPSESSEYSFIAYPISGCKQWNEMDPKKAGQSDLDAARARVGVHATTDVTLEFDLATPFPAFAQATAMSQSSPTRVEDIELRDVPGYPGHPQRVLVRYVGNGPFTLVEWTKGSRFVFERNERYRAPARLRRWTKWIIPDAATVRGAYERGDLDVASVAPSDEQDRQSLLARSDLHRTLTSCSSYVLFNTRRPPFDDANVRLAFAKALDKDDYVRNVLKTGQRAASFVPPGMPGHAPDDVQAFDVAAARDLLATSKYGTPVDGRLGGIDVVWPYAGSQTTKFVEWAAAQWLANLGVRVRTQDISGFTGPLVIRPEQIPALSRGGWCADYPSGQDWYGNVFLSSSTVQRSGFADPLFDDTVARADRDPNPAMRDGLYAAASERLSREAPAAWIVWPERWSLVRPAVRGYELTPFDWDFSQLAITKIVGVNH